MDTGASEFVAAYGRRRVGKTFLANLPVATQLANFHLAITKYAPPGMMIDPASDWLAVSHQLSQILEEQKKAKKVVFHAK